MIEDDPAGIPTPETVGPVQYTGEDEPGPDHNKRADLLAEPAPPAEAAQEVGSLASETVTQIPVTEPTEDSPEHFTMRPGEESSQLPEAQTAAVEQPEQIATPEDQLLSPENPMNPESPERIADTKNALDKLVEAAKQYAHPFHRDVVRVEYEYDPRYAGGVNGADPWFEKKIPVKTGNEELLVLQLWTYPDPESNAAYRLSLGFAPSKEANNTSTQRMLSIESPAPINPYGEHIIASWRSGLPIEARRIQDYLYSDGAESVPVRQADFTRGYDYRPMGSEVVYPAGKAEMDVMLKLLANANIMLPGGEKGPKAAELVPELTALATEG